MNEAEPQENEAWPMMTLGLSHHTDEAHYMSFMHSFSALTCLYLVVGSSSGVQLI